MEEKKLNHVDAIVIKKVEEKRMIKKLRDKAKGKKGFTLVELIVVIVIILILAAVLVPQLLKYVDRANQANAKADAATILSQVQADFADAKITTAKPGDFTVNGVPVERVDSNGDGGGITTPDADNAQYSVKTENNVDSITGFAYNNGRYTATWTQAAGWTVEQTTTPAS